MTTKSPFRLPNLPKLRFKGFGGEWEEKKFCEISEIKRGSSPRPINDEKWFSNISDVGWLRIADIKHKNLLKTSQYLSDIGQKNTTIVDSNQLIMSICGSVCVPCFTQIKIGMPDSFVWFKNCKVDLFFLYYFLIKTQQFYSMGQPGSQINLNSSIISKGIIKLPSLLEQQKIAKFFSLLDKQIELWETKLKLNEQKEKYYQNLFLYDANLFSLNIVKIMDIFDIKRGNVLNTRNVSTNKDSFFQYPVYSSQTLHNGLMGYYNEYLFEKCITWTTDGANAGNVTYREEKFYCTNVSGVLIKKTNTNIFPDLCKAIIINKMCKKFVSTQLGNPKLMNNTMGNVSIEIPDENLSKILSSFFKKFLDNKNNINLVISILTKRKIFYFSNIFN